MNENPASDEDVAQLLWARLSETERERLRAVLRIHADARELDGESGDGSIATIMVGVDVETARSDGAARDTGDQVQNTVPATVGLVEDEPVPFRPIGIGRPLRITLEQVYVGANPNWRGELLVTSTAAATENSGAGTTAMNWWGRGLKPHDKVPLNDASAGSDVLYYSPAESSDKLDLAVNLKFDNFDRDQWDAWSKAASKIGSLPIVIGGFVTGGPAGAATGQAIVGVTSAGSNLAIALLDRAIDGGNSIQMTTSISIERAGLQSATPGYKLLTEDRFIERYIYEDGSESHRLASYISFEDDVRHPVYLEVDGTHFYVHRETGRLMHKDGGSWPNHPGWTYEKDSEVRGPWPYALILVDGAERSSLAKWKPAAVTAELAAKFLNRPKGDEIPNLAADVFTAWSDASMVNVAGGLQRQIKDVDVNLDRNPNDDALKNKKELYEKQLEAAIDSIQNEKLQDLIKADGTKFTGQSTDVGKRPSVAGNKRAKPGGDSPDTVEK